VDLLIPRRANVSDEQAVVNASALELHYTRTEPLASELNASDTSKKFFECTSPMKSNNLYEAVVVAGNAVTGDWSTFRQTQHKPSKPPLELVQLTNCVQIRRQHVPEFGAHVGKCRVILSPTLRHFQSHGYVLKN